MPTARRWSGLAAEEPVEYLDLEDLVDLAYPELWTKAAALLDSVVNNHALVDGNKRLGWLATAVFLDLNGIDVSVAGNDDVYDLVMSVAGGHHTVAEIADRLRGLDHRRY